MISVNVLSFVFFYLFIYDSLVTRLWSVFTFLIYEKQGPFSRGAFHMGSRILDFNGHLTGYGNWFRFWVWVEWWAVGFRLGLGCWYAWLGQALVGTNLVQPNRGCSPNFFVSWCIYFELNCFWWFSFLICFWTLENVELSTWSLRIKILEICVELDSLFLLLFRHFLYFLGENVDFFVIILCILFPVSLFVWIVLENWFSDIKYDRKLQTLGSVPIYESLYGE